MGHLATILLPVDLWANKLCWFHTQDSHHHLLLPGLLSKLHAYIKKGNCMQRTDNRGDFHGGIQYLYGSLFLKGAKTRARRTRQ
jgi:hypothetical protein